MFIRRSKRSAGEQKEDDGHDVEEIIRYWLGWFGSQPSGFWPRHSKRRDLVYSGQRRLMAAFVPGGSHASDRGAAAQRQVGHASHRRAEPITAPKNDPPASIPDKLQMGDSVATRRAYVMRSFELRSGSASCGMDGIPRTDVSEEVLQEISNGSRMLHFRTKHGRCWPRASVLG